MTAMRGRKVLPFLLVLALAVSLGCGRKATTSGTGGQVGSLPEVKGATVEPATSPEQVAPASAPGEASAPSTATQGAGPASTGGSAATVASQRGPGRVGTPNPTVRVSLTRKNVNQYISVCQKVSLPASPPPGGQGQAKSPEEQRQEAAKRSAAREAAVAKALGGSGLTSESFSALDARIRLAMRRLSREEGGGNAPGGQARQQPGAETGQPSPPGSASQAGKAPGSMTEENRRAMEARRQQMETEMASIASDELALVKASRQQIESAWQKSGLGFFRGGSGRGGRGGGAGGGATGT